MLAALLSVQFSFCPNPPRMVRSFRYQVSQEEALLISRQVLENLGYEIEFFTKESYLIKTINMPVKKDFRRYDYSLAIVVEDRVEAYIIAQKHIFKRGSETSIGGGKSMTEMDTVDWLPYSLQKKIYLPLIDEFSKNGLTQVELQRVHSIKDKSMIDA
ncbi:MAG: hypothetical protein ACE5D0_07985 [Fidelibacterota bacterium]